MRAEELIAGLRNRTTQRGLTCIVAPPAAEADLAALAQRLGVPLPASMLHFYRACDGLQVEDPAVEVWPVARLTVDSARRLPFAVFDQRHVLAFAARARNAADQWDIVAIASGAVVTKTMAGFWSNKLFAWIDKRREVWLPTPVPPCEEPDSTER